MLYIRGVQYSLLVDIRSLILSLLILISTDTDMYSCLGWRHKQYKSPLLSPSLPTILKSHLLDLFLGHYNNNIYIIYMYIHNNVGNPGIGIFLYQYYIIMLISLGNISLPILPQIPTLYFFFMFIRFFELCVTTAVFIGSSCYNYLLSLIFH